jgi:DNA-binding transcriptional LysR family regulator
MRLPRRHAASRVQSSLLKTIRPFTLSFGNMLLSLEAPVADAGPRPALRLVGSEVRPTVSDLADVSPRLLRCFLTVAEELHFGRAADRLFVAQPALSRSIQQLERILDRPLFVRTTRAVEITPIAHLLLDPAREIIEALNALAADLAGAHAVLRVAHIPSSDTTALILDRLSRTDPSVRVEERTISGHEQLDAVRAGLLDVAICRQPASPPEGLRSELVRLDPLLVALLGREPNVDRPVDVRRRTVAATSGTTEDPDYAAFIDAYEQRVECKLRRVGVSAGSGTEAYAMRRNRAFAFVTLASRGVRLDAPCPVAPAAPVQAYFPWSVIWRPTQRSTAVGAFLDAARCVATERGWCDVSRLPGEPWIGADIAVAGHRDG